MSEPFGVKKRLLWLEIITAISVGAKMNEHNEHIGRNDPCWCGSGKKFKKCHLNRADQPKIPISEVLSESKKAFSSKYCLHPDKSCCSGNIIL